MKDSLPQSGPSFSAFLPTFLVGLSLLIMLSWQVFLGVRQYRSGLDVQDRQALLMAQATQAEEFLQKLMMDLIELAKTDADARDIVQRFNITFAPPATAPVAAALAPGPVP